MKSSIAVIPVCLGLLQGFAAAGEMKVKMNDLPPAVQAAVKEQSKGAAIRGLSKEVENGKTEYEAELTVDGQRRPVRARQASAEEKAELWPRVVAAYGGYAGYQRRTQRDIPLVLCDPR